MRRTSKMDLPQPRRRLVELMQEINFGRIENAQVKSGQLQFEPSLTIVRELKFCAENGSRPERHADDFALKSQVVEMFDHLDRIRDCHIESLEIKHGLPFRMLIREDAA